MNKTILITGSTDGLGLEVARQLAAQGHRVMLHGRSEAKLQSAKLQLESGGASNVLTFAADLSDLAQVTALAGDVQAHCDQLDVLINNAGVFKTPQPVLANGRDSRFVVNTVAPYLLTRKLLPLMDATGRVVNL